MGSRASSHRGYWLPGLIALSFLVLGALVINFVGLRHVDPTVLHGRDVETRIGQELQALQGLSQPPQVSCPASEPVRQGMTFTCTVHGHQGTEVLHVTETNGRGTFSYRTATPAARR